MGHHIDYPILQPLGRSHLDGLWAGYLLPLSAKRTYAINPYSRQPVKNILIKLEAKINSNKDIVDFRQEDYNTH